MSIKEKMNMFITTYEKRKKEAIEFLRESFTEEELEQTMDDLEKYESKYPEFIVVMDGSRKKLSPQLKQRFDFCDRLVDITEIMLGIEDIKEQIIKDSFIEWYSVMKSEWFESAPQLYKKSDISIFSVASEENGDYCLLVWKKNKIEPELWRYSGQSEQIFSDLSEYLDWLND